MLKLVKRQIKDKQIQLDDSNYKNTEFIRCQMYYAGTGPFRLDSCSFDSCTWTMLGGAASGLNMLQVLSRQPGFLQVFQDTFPHLDIHLKPSIQPQSENDNG